jgi:hypothetical protein
MGTRTLLTRDTREEALGARSNAIISAQYTYPSEADVEDQVSDAMANDGLMVVSIQDEVDEMEQEMCAEWDTTLGTPLPEFNCEDQ